jgi:acyl-coenzyme A thioesterase PaaI-like protein
LQDLKIRPRQIASDESERPLHACGQSSCFACGPDNPRGLQIRFEREGSGEIIATWVPAPTWVGFRGIVHGGVVSTVLDEAMSKAVAGTGTEALTVELRVRFRHHVTPGGTFLVRGWIVSRNSRMTRTEAVLVATDGTEHAHAWATFLPCINRSPTIEAPRTAQGASHSRPGGEYAIRSDVHRDRDAGPGRTLT